MRAIRIHERLTLTNTIVSTLVQYWTQGRKTKVTQGGWISGNAVCCTHNNERADTRKRGGLLAHADSESVSYSCFNCGFKTSWQQGRSISSKFKALLHWLNIPDEAITRITFEALRLKDEAPTLTPIVHTPLLLEKLLPPESKPLLDWNVEEMSANDMEAYISVVDYLMQRGYSIDSYAWHWSPEPSYKSRLLIPFYYKGRIVGHTARSIKPVTQVKYLTEQQTGYVFNLDNQKPTRNCVILVEGPLDAIAVDGIATMGNTISKQQKALIDQLNREVIVVPDRDAAGSNLIKQAIEFGWSVSMPEWDEHIKDLSDAHKVYGRLYTLQSIISAKTNNALKIQLRAKHWIHN